MERLRLKRQMDEPNQPNVTTTKMLQTTLDTFTLYKTEQERLQAIVDKLNASGNALNCYVGNGQIVTELG